MTIKQLTAEIRKTANEISSTRPTHQIRLARLGDRLFDLTCRYDGMLRAANLTRA